MPEDDDTVQDSPEAKGKGKGRAKEGKDREGKEKDVNVTFARALARALWQPQFKAANPDMSHADITAVWKPLRQEQTKPLLTALRGLQRRGYSFIAPPDEDVEEADTAPEDDANS